MAHRRCLRHDGLEAARDQRDDVDFVVHVHFDYFFSDRADEGALEMQPSSSKRARLHGAQVQLLTDGDDLIGRRVRWYGRDKRTWYQGTVTEAALEPGYVGYYLCLDIY